MSNFKEDLPKIKAFVFDNDGVLSKCDVSLNSDGTPIRSANVKDGYILQYARKLGYIIAIITGADSPQIRNRFANLGITDTYYGSSKKIIDYQKFKEKYNLDDSEILYMGDDIPDLEVMKTVGVPCCPIDAAVEIKQVAKYISHLKGGYGCVRDVVEQTLKAQGKWLQDDIAVKW